MASFQSIIIYTALAILIILLIIVSINLHYAKTNVKWPPIIGNCPDYWYDEGTNGSKCVINNDNVNLGTATSPMDFSGNAYTGKNGNCVKYQWANSKSVSWDGITYGVENPCIEARSNILSRET